MATLKLTLDKRRKYQDGRSPVVIRLTQNGKSTSIPTGVRIQTTDWDKNKCRVLRKHPNQQDLNHALQKQLLDYEQKLVQVEVNAGAFNGVAELKGALTNDPKNVEVLFHEFAKEQVEHLRKQGRFGNAQSYLTASNRIIEFAGEGLKLNTMDYAFILQFEKFLTERGVGTNGIAAYMRAVRALLNKAGKLGLADSNKYPFKHYTIRTERTPSRAETIEVLRKLLELEFPTDSEKYHARNVFFLIFGLIGISFIDLITLKKSDIKAGRVHYKRKKTGKLYSIKLTPLVTSILNEYENPSSSYLLPQFGMDEATPEKVRHLSNLGLKRTNRYLKQIGRELDTSSTLTTYVARYSWANIAKSLGYSKDLIAESLGHSYGNAVTGIYLENYGDQTIDVANNKVLSSVIIDSKSVCLL